MKKLIFIIYFFFIYTTLTAQQTYVPDDNFEQALINLGYDDVLDNYVPTTNISSITNLDVSNSRFGTDDFGIINLTGIEDFVSLESLDCSQNNIISLNFTFNPALKTLFCNSNDLNYLNVTSNTELTTLNCNSNDLTELNVKFNPNLEILFCVSNNIKSLDTSFNPVLVRLRCSENNLTFLNIKNGNNYNFAGDVVIGFEATSNPDLTCIQVDDADYSRANWSFKDATAFYNEKCYAYIPDDAFEQYLIDEGYDSGPLDDYALAETVRTVPGLFMQNKGISDLTGIECFTELNVLDCRYNNLISLDLSHNIYLLRVDCSNNDLTSLTLGGLLETLDCSNNELIELDLDINSLEELHCSYNELTSLQVRSNSLVTLSCSNNELTNLYLEGVNLISVGCDNNNLTNLGINGAYRLSELSCNNNVLTYLDVASFNLTYLSCSNNNLTSIENLDTNTLLEIFNCNDNDITSLDLSSNNIYSLECNNNNITSLDLSTNSNLRGLDCSNNNLTTLNMQNGTNSDVLSFNATVNPDLTCIQVDDAAYSNANWTHKDDTASYSSSCYNPLLVYLPDNFFEQFFIDLGLDDILDDYIFLDKVINIQKLDISNKNISDLTGIEYLTSLETLYCQNNRLTNLDLSLNTALSYLNCSNNQLETLNLKNGNNTNFIYLNTTGNSSLMCIQVDNEDYSYNNWKSDGSKHFCIDKYSKLSENCELLSVTDIKDKNLKLYPNPISEKFTIQLQNGFKLKKLRLYNHIGQIIKEGLQNTMDVSKLSKGIYFIQVETNRGKSAKKIVIE